MSIVALVWLGGYSLSLAVCAYDGPLFQRASWRLDVLALVFFLVVWPLWLAFRLTGIAPARPWEIDPPCDTPSLPTTSTSSSQSD